MLVLSRSVNEEIVINDDIIITVLRMQGNKVRLGIKAPRSVQVHRMEIYEAIQRAKRAEGGDNGQQD